MRNAQVVSRQLHMIFGPWLNNVFNKVDHSRIEDVGADIACAEWLLRCGGQVKFLSSDSYHSDYNTLPRIRNKFKIESIDATESCVSDIGFLHLDGLQHVNHIKLHKCQYVNDKAISIMVHHLKSTLGSVHISSCGNITDQGIMNLVNLMHLRNLHLFDLHAVKDLAGCVDLLRKGLPACELDFRASKY